MMGSDDPTDDGVNPPRLEKVKAFYMSKYLVTQEQYEAVMGAKPIGSFDHDKNLPVDSVSWYDAIVFCNRLSIAEGLSPVYSISGTTDPEVWIADAGGTIPDYNSSSVVWDLWDATIPNWKANGYRLPTEVEWEYACRAGTTTAYNTGPSISTSQANFSPNPGDSTRTTPAGSFDRNRWGLYDMHGNLWEWCGDWHPSYPTHRVLRGGSWNNSFGHLRSVARNIGIPSYQVNDYGFRVVRRP